MARQTRAGRLSGRAGRAGSNQTLTPYILRGNERANKQFHSRRLGKPAASPPRATPSILPTTQRDQSLRPGTGHLKLQNATCELQIEGARSHDQFAIPILQLAISLIHPLTHLCPNHGQIIAARMAANSASSIPRGLPFMLLPRELRTIAGICSCSTPRSLNRVGIPTRSLIC